MFQMLLLIFADSTSASKMEPFIVGGRFDSIENWPFIAFVEISIFGVSTYACGGSLISSQTVLTAAHCLDDVTYQKTWMTGIGFKIYMGHTWYMNAKLTRNVIDYETHMHYSPDDETITGDIGVMFLNMPVRFSASIKKVILQRGFNVKEDTHLVVAGWGSPDPEGDIGSDRLKSVKMTPKKFKTCRYLEKVICTISDDDHYPYKGDSGGPIVNARTKRQVGIVSFRDVNTGISVFTRVPDYYDWIAEKQYVLFRRYCGK